MVLTGAPRPAFYDGLLVQQVPPESVPETVDGWRSVDADGVTCLPAEAFVAMNQFFVPGENAAAFEQRWASRGQPGDATAAKDVSSERVDSATVKGGFIYVVGSITSASDKYADFGVTKYPLECSRGKTVGQKGASLAKLNDAPCAGKIQSQGPTSANLGKSDVFLVKFAARGAP